MSAGPTIEVEQLHASLSWPCKDRNGKLTELLVVKCPHHRFKKEFRERGNPVTVDFDRQVVHEEKDALEAWLGLMSNIDLSDEDNRLAAGVLMIEKARAMVRNLFVYLAEEGW